MKYSFIMKFFAVLFIMSLLSLSILSCSNSNIPMPISAILTNTNEILVPFPILDKFSNGDEQWIITRNNSNEQILQISFNSKIIAQFPANMAGQNIIDSEIIIDGKKFNVKRIALNIDQISGYIILEKSEYSVR